MVFKKPVKIKCFHKVTSDIFGPDTDKVSVRRPYDPYIYSLKHWKTYNSSNNVQKDL